MIAGHYRLLERIGSGAMGVVWRARDERLERVVAVKQLLLQPGLSEQQRQDLRKRAMREARIAARLHHSNAIVVFDVAEHEGDPYLVMEYLASRSLAAVLTERGSLPVEDVAALGSQIAAALAAAHASGIVHRDVKPGNVLIADSGIAKITDFGIARAVGDLTLTQTGTFAGTPAYLAPEVARGHDPSTASDVFSLGATLFDAVEGGPPFPERQNQLALLHLVAEGKVQPPKQAGALTSLLTKLLRSDPADRPTMAQASAILADLAGAKPQRPALLTAAVRSTLNDLAPVPAESPAPTTQGTPVIPDTRVASNVPASPPTPPRRPVPTAAVPIPPGRDAKLAESRKRLRLALIAAAVLVVVIAGIGITLLATSSSGGSDNASGGGNSGTGTNGQPTAGNQGTGGSGGTGTSSGATTTSAPPPASVNPAAVVQLEPAGTLIVNFYSDVQGNVAAAWNELTPNAQAMYGGGGEAAFANYWAAHPIPGGPHGAAGNANGNPGHYWNADGSANMTINLDLPGGQTKTVSLIVVQQGGQLLINSDTRIG